MACSGHSEDADTLPGPALDPEHGTPIKSAFGPRCLSEGGSVPITVIVFADPCSCRFLEEPFP